MIKKTVRILTLFLLFALLLGGFDFMVAHESESVSAKGDAILGVVGSVAADEDVCPDGRPGCKTG